MKPNDKKNEKTINTQERKEEFVPQELIEETVLDELKAIKGLGKDDELSPEDIDDILEELDKAEVWLTDGTCKKGNENEKNGRGK